MVASRAATTALTFFGSTPEVCARWATRVVLLKVSLMGFSALPELAAVLGAAFGAVFFVAALAAAFFAVAMVH